MSKHGRPLPRIGDVFVNINKARIDERGRDSTWAVKLEFPMEYVLMLKNVIFGDEGLFMI